MGGDTQCLAASPGTSPAGPRDGRGRGWRTGALIFFGCLAVYHVNGRNQSGVDTIPPVYTSWALAKHGTLDLAPYPELRRFFGTSIQQSPDGRWVSIRSPGSALAALPVFAALAPFHESPLRPVNMAHLGKLAGAASVSAAAVVFFFLCRRLAPAAAVPATVLFAFGTSLWSVSSQSLWTHGPATFWLCCALYLSLGPAGGSRLRWTGVGLAIGMAFFSRPPTALFGGATAVALAGGRRWGDLARLLTGALPPVALYVLSSWSLFGSPLLGGYVRDDWGTVTPLWLGVSGLLAAPSRGLLVYSPALLLVPAGVRALLRARPPASDDAPLRRRLLLGWLGAAAATVVFYARWHDWVGGWCFGPRFLCETLPVLCLLFAYGYAALRSSRARRGAASLVALSVAVHLVGIFGSRAAEDWYLRHDASRDQGRCMFSLRDTQIEAYARGTWDSIADRLYPARATRKAPLAERG